MSSAVTEKEINELTFMLHDYIKMNIRVPVFYPTDYN